MDQRVMIYLPSQANSVKIKLITRERLTWIYSSIRLDDAGAGG